VIIEKYETKGCCSKTSLFFKLSKSITQEIANTFVQSGFIQQEHFKKAGICYLTNNDVIISAPFNANKIQVKCKSGNCSNIINNIISILETL